MSWQSRLRLSYGVRRKRYGCSTLFMRFGSNGQSRSRFIGIEELDGNVALRSLWSLAQCTASQSVYRLASE